MAHPETNAENILAAMGEFDREFRKSDEWLAWEDNGNHRYAIRHSDRLYPVKKILSIATGRPVSTFSGGPLSNSVFSQNGFSIVPMERAESENGIERDLQSLILADNDLNHIEDSLSEINLFEAIGAVRSELRHSDFLSYLLDPSQNHGLGTLFIRRLCQKALVADVPKRSDVSALQIGVWDLDDSVVERESDDTDILITSKRNKLAIVIENKVDSSEHSNQLQKYFDKIATRFPEFNCLFIFLTTDGADASHEKYVPLSYSTVCEVVEDIIRGRGNSLAPDLAVLLRHYAKLLRRHFMDEEELSKIAQKFYANHRRALDYIFEKRPDFQLSIKDKLESLIRPDSSLVLDRCAKSHINFAPADWSQGIFVSGEGWTTSRRALLFEFKNSRDRVSLSLVLGPCDADVRREIFNFCLQHQPPFKVSGTTLYSRWNQIWAKKILSSKDLEEENLEATNQKLDAAWSDFMKHDFPAVTSELTKFVAGLQVSES